MIRTLLDLIPADDKSRVVRFTSLALVSIILRAVSAVLLVPLVAALFSDDPSHAWPWVGLVTLVVALGALADWFAARVGTDIGFGLLDSVQHRIADQLVRTEPAWLDATTTPVARSAVAASSPHLVGIVVYLVAPVLAAIVLPLAIAVALLPIAWQLALVALAGVPLLLGAYLASLRIGRSADRVAEAANRTYTERIIEFARTQAALRAARRVTNERSLVGDALRAQHTATMRLILAQIPGQLIFSIASQIALVGLAGTTVALAVTGELSIPEAIALIVVIARYLEPFTMLADLSAGVENASGVLGRMRQVLDAPVVATGTVTRSVAGAPRIELDRVTVRHDDGPAVFEDFSLTLEPGQTTAIVGPSGAGKSTVLGVIAGLVTPTTGRVLVDGVDLATLDEPSRRAVVSMVFQEPFLFDGTIRENILVGDPNADDAAVADGAARARLGDVITRSANGLDARVGERGSALSGGERQRVSIARALVKPAPVLLVDEATSALDTENEAAVVSALTDDPSPRTRVIVAHRLASIRSADRVIMLESGRVVEDGPLQDLLAADGRVAQFWRQREDAGAWTLGDRSSR